MLGNRGGTREDGPGPLLPFFSLSECDVRSVPSQVVEMLAVHHVCFVAIRKRRNA